MNKLFSIFGVMILTAGIALASQPVFNGQYEITGVDGNTNTGWRLTGTFEDASLSGWSASDCPTNTRVFSYSGYGDVDKYKVTNIVVATGVNLTVDVIYDETGTPRSGAPSPGYQIMIGPGADGVVYEIPTIGKLSELLQNYARNLTLKYAIAYAATSGVSSISSTGAVSGAITFSGDGVTQTGAVFNFSGGGGGAGTITNMLTDAVTSIVWTASGGPQPSGSVTAYVSSVVAGMGDFKADGSVPMTGNLNGGGQLATNFPNLVQTNTPDYQNLVTNTATFAQGVTADAALPKVGGTMTGPLTNTYGYYGDGIGLTNLVGTEPLWTADSNQVQTDISGLKGATGSYYQTSNPDGFVAGLLKSGNTATIAGKVYQQLSDGTWQFAVNTNVNNCNKAVGIAYGTNSSSAGMVVIGLITVTNNNLEIGSNLYVGATAGEWTQTAPSANGSVIRAIGYAKNTNEIYMTPSPVWVEVGDLINADVNFNTYDATNIGALAAASLQVTGGSPTNGAVWIATNTAGQGKWSLPVGFEANMTANFVFSNNTERTVAWTAEAFDLRNNFSATTFTAPVAGLYGFYYNIHFQKVAGTGVGLNQVKLYSSGVCVFQKQHNLVNVDTDPNSSASKQLVLTNNATVYMGVFGAVSSTNQIFGNANYSFFGGHLIRELP